MLSAKFAVLQVFLFYKDGARINEIRGVNLPQLEKFIYDQIGVTQK